MADKNFGWRMRSRAPRASTSGQSQAGGARRALGMRGMWISAEDDEGEV